MNFDGYGPRMNREALLAELLMALIDALTRSGRRGRPRHDDRPALEQAEGESVAEFVKERCTVGPKSWCTVGELKDEYEDWAADRGEEWAVNRRAFARRLREMGCLQERRRVPGVGLARLWVGIGLREAEPAPRSKSQGAKKTQRNGASRRRDR